MNVQYGGKIYKVEQVTGDVYRVYNVADNTGAVFTTEYRNGTYFKFRSAWKGSRGYSATRYSYKWIPIMREAAYLIARTEGLYCYTDGKWYIIRDGKYYLK